MAIADTLLPEYDHEIATTRTLLERLPDEHFGWKPHARSFTLGQLAQHLATLPSWGAMTLRVSEFDLAEGQQPPAAASRADILAAFESNAATAREELSRASDAELMAPWTLKNGGQTLFSMPKASVWRSFVMNHLIHHRGQLSVYLRLRDIALPSIYGPSADERTF